MRSALVLVATVGVVLGGPTISGFRHIRVSGPY